MYIFLQPTRTYSKQKSGNSLFYINSKFGKFLAQIFIYLFIEISFASKNTLRLLSPCTPVPSTYSLG
jgi:hypothetical protein